MQNTPKCNVSGLDPLSLLLKVKGQLRTSELSGYKVKVTGMPDV